MMLKTKKLKAKCVPDLFLKHGRVIQKRSGKVIYSTIGSTEISKRAKNLELYRRFTVGKRKSVVIIRNEKISTIAMIRNAEHKIFKILKLLKIAKFYIKLVSKKYLITTKIVKKQFCDFSIRLKTGLIEKYKHDNKPNKFQVLPKVLIQEESKDYLQKIHRSDYSLNSGNKTANGVPKINSEFVENLTKYVDVQKKVCNICEKSYSSKATVKMHIKNVHFKKTKDFQCKICDRNYKYKNSLRIHLINSHSLVLKSSNITCICDKCGKDFNTKKSLVGHLKSHSIEYVCGICGHQSESYKAVERHNILVHNNKKAFKCEFCHKTYKTQGARNSHKKVSHTDVQWYPKCTRHFQSYAVRKHYKDHSDIDRRQECEYCKKILKHERSLKTHIKFYHTQQDLKTHKCTKCDMAFKRKDVLVNHGKTHDDKRPYKCKKCAKTYKNLKCVNRHFKNSHRERKREISCDICSGTYMDIQGIRAHMKIHLPFKPVKCSYRTCKKTFRDQTHMNAHIKSHTKEKPYSCSVCTTKFSCNNALRNHLANKHSQEFNFHCLQPKCNQKFKLKQHLTSHYQKCHSKTSFTCDKCGKSIKMRATIITHLRNHVWKENVWKFKCPHNCWQGFCTKKALNSHIKEMHTY